MPALPFRHTLAAGLLAFAPLVLSLALPGTISAQTVLAVPPQQCVWRAGDDPAWAAAHLDESGWQPYTQWEADPAEPRIWIRCHANLGPLEGSADPAIQVGAHAAYELYLNSQLLGGAGNLSDGSFNVDYLRAYPINSGLLSTGASILALRVAPRSLISDSGPLRNLLASPLEIRAGDSNLLSALRARSIIVRSAPIAKIALCYGAIGVIAIMILGLWFYDRSRHELVLLSVSCLSLAIIRVNEFCAAALWNMPVSVSLFIVTACNVSFTYSQLPFLYALARRRVPFVYWVLLALTALGYLPSAIGALFLKHQPSWLGPLNLNINRPMTLVLHMSIAVAPFIAFRPYSGISRRMRPLAALCMLWGLADLTWFVLQATSTPIFPIPGFFASVSIPLLEIRAFTTAFVLAALLGLLFREQRQATEEHAMLAGEMASAREIQQYLIPEKLPPTPGLEIASVYLPSREVGGDFFQVLPDPRDGSTLIVVGDVAGKGLKAGMLAALIVGAIRTAFKFTADPGRILALLNERLQGRGLVTCLAMRIDREGGVELANAGHLPPYLNGREMATEGALPLGALPDAAFPATHFRLSGGEPLLLVSDGVIEARNKTGELFGFERTRDLSTESAQSIASAASDFGQEDDITVLTLAFAPAEVIHA